MVGVVLLIIIYRITHSYIAIATYLSQLARIKIILQHSVELHMYIVDVNNM